MAFDSGWINSVSFGAKRPFWWLFLPLLWYNLLPMAQGAICDTPLSSGGHQFKSEAGHAEAKTVQLDGKNYQIEGIIIAIWIALIGRGLTHPRAVWWCAVMMIVWISQSVSAESNSTIKHCCPCDVSEISLTDFEDSEDRTTVGLNIGVPPFRVAIYVVSSVVFFGGIIIFVIAVVERNYGVFLQFVPIERDGEGKRKKMKRFSRNRKKVRKIKDPSLEAQSGVASSTGSDIESEAIKRKRRDSD